MRLLYDLLDHFSLEALIFRVAFTKWLPHILAFFIKNMHILIAFLHTKQSADNKNLYTIGLRE